MLKKVFVSLVVSFFLSLSRIKTKLLFFRFFTMIMVFHWKRIGIYALHDKLNCVRT